MRAQTPVALRSCSTTDGEQRWLLEADGHVVRSLNPGSALDLYRHNNLPGLYGRASGSNQLWKGLTVSPSSLLAQLEGPALTALWAARTPSVALEVSEPEAATHHPCHLPGRHRGADQHRPGRQHPRHPDRRGRDVRGVERIEYRLAGGAWTTYTGPVKVNGAQRAGFRHRAVDVAGNVPEPVGLEPTTGGATLSASLPRMTHGSAASVTVLVAAPALGSDAEPLTGTVTPAPPGGRTVSAPVAGGRATLSVPRTVPAGTHRLALTHDGDTRLARSARTVTLRVAKASSTTVAKVRRKKKASVKASRRALAVRARVRSTFGVSTAGTVSVKVVKVTRTARGK